ncbi:O-antigen ligase family protein [Vibrio casei]|uniref:O-antigen ligase family protein n=1 Tax=Vibrio casei TaxID=673372 RepID=UPI003F9E150F
MQSYIQQYIQKLLTLLIYLPFIWLGTGLCLLDEGRSIMTKVLVVAIVALLIKYRQSSWSLKSKTKQQRYTCLAMLIFVLYLFGLQLYHGADEGLIRVVLLTSAYFYLFPLERFDKNWLIGALIANGFLLAIFIYHYEFTLHAQRLVGMEPNRVGPLNAIPFATYCLLAAISQCYHTLIHKHWVIKCLLIVSAVVSTSAILFTESRGVFLALVSVFILYFIHILCKQPKSTILKIIPVILLLLGGIAVLQKDDIQSRYTQTLWEIQQLQNNNMGTSMGLRLQFWKSGTHTITDYPIFGIGNDHFRPEFKKHYEQGLITKLAYQYSPMHYHNQYVDMTVKNGLIGLLLFLSIAWCIYQGSQISLPKYLLLGLFIASLTDVPFAHLALGYFALLLLLFSMTIPSSQEDNNDINRS